MSHAGRFTQHADGGATQADAALSGVAAVAASAANAINAFERAKQSARGGRHRTGGAADACDDYFGGAPDAEADAARSLREYEASVSAQAKEDTIRGIARALSSVGFKIDAEADPDAIIAQIARDVPNPRNGKKFKDAAEVHKDVCTKVANALNLQFSPGATKPSDKFIDTSLSPAEVCRQVGEWVHSFSLGVNTEFLAVVASVRNAMRRVKLLDEVLDRAEAGVAELAARGEPELARKAEPLADLYRRARAEHKRTFEVLEHILNIQLPPAEAALASALRDESEDHALVKRVGIRPGSSEFSAQLAAAISGLGTAAAVASRVHKALKEAGLSVREFFEGDAQRRLDAAVEAYMGTGKADTQKLARLLEAVEELRANLGNRSDAKFREQLEAMGGAATGGADDDDDLPKTKVQSQIERSRVEKRVILKDFSHRMARNYEELLQAVKALGPELGKSVPLTDKTDALRDSLDRINDMRAESNRIELSLIGLYVDAAARERKERFVSALRQVALACEDVMGLEMFRASSQLFARLKAAIDSIVKTIDNYADIIVRKYGGESVTGGADDSPADFLPEITRSGLSLGEAVGEFKFFYYVARVAENMGRTAGELDQYGEKYVDLLGDAVAQRLHTCETARKARLDRIKSDFDAVKAAATAGGAWTALGADTAGFPQSACATLDAATKYADALKKWVNDEFDTKAKFYRALQAMDLYMKAFTQAIVKDPSAVSNIKAMLDGTQTIARWYNETTGDEIAKSFEYLAAASAAPAAGITAIIADQNTDHYYQKIQRATGAAFGSTDAQGLATNDNIDKAKKSIAKAYDNFQALKNLVNAFARIGDKFGGQELRTQIFMTPTQIYKTLMDYLKQSALSAHSREGAAAAGAAADYFVQFEVTNPAAGPVAHSNYQLEDNYFALIIKAMAAKVLTTLGVYDMFERDVPLYDLTPTRMIVGGADDTDPETMEGAAELYFRLPRLVEFYRDLFRSGDLTTEQRIAMIPELEGVFSGIIKLVFLRAGELGPDTGDYSETEMRTLVRECNLVYEHYREKHSDRATQAALAAFVTEINRRFGLVKKKDYDEYVKMARIVRTGSEFGTVNDTNFSILPGEDDTFDEVERRAPSDRFAVPGEAPAPGAAFRGRTGLDTERAATGHREMLRAFRTRLEAAFSSVDKSTFGSTSYALLIEQGRGEIKRAASREERFRVAQKLIQGTHVVGTNADKAFMFHETVVTGLNTLSAMHAMLEGYSAHVDTVDPAAVELALMKRINAVTGTVAFTNKASLTANTGADQIPALMHKYIADVPAALLMQAANMYGTPLTVAELEAAFKKSFTGSADADLGFAPAPATQLERFQQLRQFARLLTDYDRCMRDYVENLFMVQSQGLVEVRLSKETASNVTLGFARFRQLAENLMTDVKAFFEMFRPHMTAATLDRYEKREQPGSIFWLEDKFIDKYFRGDGTPEDIKTCDGLARRAAAVFKHLVRDTGVDITAPIADLAIPVAPPARAANQFPQFGACFSRLVHYTCSQTDSGLSMNTAAAVNRPSPIDNNTAWPLSTLIQTARPTATGGPATLNPPKAGVAGAAAVDVFRETLYAHKGTMEKAHSLLFDYNQLLARYLSTLTDTAAGQKIYLGLINSFANGVASRSVTSPVGNAFPDLVVAGAPFGVRGDPKPEAVLFQSLAWVLQRLAKDASPTTQVPDHILATLTDVPLYMKEAMRANLPMFVRLFDLVSQKGDFIKQFMEKTTVNVSRAESPAIAAAAAAAATAATAAGSTAAQVAAAGANAAAAVRNSKVTTGTTAVADDGAYAPAGSFESLQAIGSAMPNDEMKARLAQIIDAISAGAYTLSNAASEVLKELSDSPAWLQTNENSIETYRMRYGKLPLMPLSSALWFLKAVPAAGADERLFPRHTLGTPEFKMLYGARQLLAKSTPVTFAEMPSVRASLEAYNGVSAKREQIDEARYLKFVQGVVSALRYVTDVRSVRTQLSTTGRQHRFAPGDFNMAGSGIGNDNTVYALSGASIQDVLTLTESSNQDEQAQKLSARVHVQTSRTHTATGRKLERTLNLIDMNIIPINVHALMRDIPLANLYNYEYTFEQMAASLFGEQMTAYDGAATNTRRMFLQLLADPYLQVTADQFGSDQYADPREGYLHRIFRGDNNLGMNRPKFLSDQLFNKALFGSVYQSRADWDEAGPSTGIGMARGFQWTEQDRLLAQSMLVQLSAAERNFPTGLAAVPAPAPQPPQRVWAPSGPRFSTPALQTAVTNEGAAHTAYAGTIAAGPTIAQFNAYGAALRTLIATLQAVVRAPRADHPAQRRSALTFLDSSADAADTADRVVEVAIPAADKAALETIGRGRFDTHFVRNMMFVTNVVRLLRLKLNRELTQSRNVVLSSHLAVAPSVTEYGSDPYGPNETSGSQQWMDQRR